MTDDQGNVVRLPRKEGPRLRANERLVEQVEYHGVTITVIENTLTRRCTARFVILKPIPFAQTTLRPEEALRRAKQLIDKTLGK